MKKIKNLFFDLDGTVLDTSEDLADAVNFVCEKYDFPINSEEQIRKNLGNGIKNLVKNSIPKDISNFDDVFKDFKDYYSQNLHNKTNYYNDIEKVLKILKFKDYKMAILSNKFNKGVQKIKEHFRFDNYFIDAIGEDENIPKKPDIFMLKQILKKHSLNINETIYIGDGETDIEFAKNANIPSIAVTWGFRNKEYLSSLNPSYMVNTPMEIIQIIEEING